MTTKANAAAVQVEDNEDMKNAPALGEGELTDAGSANEATSETPDMDHFGDLPDDQKTILLRQHDKIMRKFKPLIGIATSAINRRQSVQEYFHADPSRADNDNYAKELMESDDPIMVMLREAGFARHIRGGFDAHNGSKAQDHLLIGDKGSFFDETVGNAAPWAREKIDEGVRRYPVMGGTTFGLPKSNLMAVPASLRWYHVTKEGVIGLFNKGKDHGRTVSRRVRWLGYGAFSAYCLFKWWSAPTPDWVSDLGWMPWLQYQLSAILEMAGLTSFNEMLLKASILATVVGTVEALRKMAAQSAAFAYTDVNWNRYCAELTREYCTPTVEAEAVAKQGDERTRTDTLRKVYNLTVQESKRRKENGVPVMNLARALGIALSRGSKMSPEAGQWITVDGDSWKQNWGIIGGTGQGKTARLITPLFRTVTRAFNALTSMKFGMFIVDPKGGLHESLKPHIPASRMADYDVIGVRPGQAAIDLFDGLTADEVQALMKALALKTVGQGNEKIWLENASLVFGSAGHLATFIEDKGMEEHFFGSLGCRAFSLKGLYTIAADDVFCAQIVDFVYKKEEELKGSVPRKVLEAANYFTNVWKEMAPETRESIRMSLTTALGSIIADEQLCAGFACGVFESADDNGEGRRMRKVTDVLYGAIFGIALGSTSSPGEAGTIVMHILKGRLYQEANKRLTRAKLAQNLLRLIDDIRDGKLKALNDKVFEYAEVYNGIVDATECIRDENPLNETTWSETRGLFLSRIPFLTPAFAASVKTIAPDISSRAFKEVVFEMSRLTNREIDSVRRLRAEYTDDLCLMASGEDPDGLAKLEKDAIAPDNNLCLVVIDEAQEVLTGGTDPICDEVFFAKARETGVFALVATQSVSHMNSVLKNHDSTNAILNNLTNMIVLSTKDAPTIKYIVELINKKKRYLMTNTNMRAQFSHISYEHPDTPYKLEDRMTDTPSMLYTMFAAQGEYTLGQRPFNQSSHFKTITVGSHDALMNYGVRSGNKMEIDDQRAMREHILARERELNEILRSGRDEYVIEGSDFQEFQQGVAFVMINNSNRTVYDFAHFKHFSYVVDEKGEPTGEAYYDPANDDELQAELSEMGITLDEAMEQAAEAA